MGDQSRVYAGRLRLHRRVRRLVATISRDRNAGLLREAELTAGDLVSGPRVCCGPIPTLFQAYLDARAHSLSFSVAAVINPTAMSSQRRQAQTASWSPSRGVFDFAAADLAAAILRTFQNGEVFIALRPIEGSPTPSSTPPARSTRWPTRSRATRRTSPRRSPISSRIGTTSSSASPPSSSCFADDADLGGLDRAHLRQPALGPIRRLIRATDEVASGNLSCRCRPAVRGRSRASRRHLQQDDGELRQQRNRLTAANALNDERRAFIEAALSGVPACVIGVDAQRASRSATQRRRSCCARRVAWAGGTAHRRCFPPGRRRSSRRRGR